VSDSEAIFLEREREVEEISGALADAGEGRGRIVLVEAPAGLGKTSLLDAANEVAVGARTLGSSKGPEREVLKPDYSGKLSGRNA
jgi:hypothetical protein